MRIPLCVATTHNYPEGDMVNMNFKGDGERFEVRLTGTWRALAAIVSAGGAILAAPTVVQFLAWWLGR